MILMESSALGTIKNAPAFAGAYKIRGTTLIYNFRTSPSTGSELTHLVRIMLLTAAFADEFMGDLLNGRSVPVSTNHPLSVTLHPVFLPNHHFYNAILRLVILCHF